ncbi:DUF6188 family protein [Mycolicibacterium fallax]|uniref:Uncharacterized protein n=1 Tax=Mycolicibacterium fallax TaxID=1793 RepID=A0A1X1R5B4_MYCFA|nr:DUF6188 family protein [Mycolicibacterium fallax]ORU99824.1 hypothetical protein AWC04_16555 [Mycolicibacterium fallax]BBZ00198.1 hypothetical protein MFAL_36640 [Mycolicibacterium fallax]
MVIPWIEQRTVMRLTLRDGLVLDFEDNNELVIVGPIRLTLPPVGPYPEEQIGIDPRHVAVAEIPLLNLSGAVCTAAACTDDGRLHLEFSRGHRIDVEPTDDTTSWELYGRRHGYLACLPHGRLRVLRHDLPDDQGHPAAS